MNDRQPTASVHRALLSGSCPYYIVPSNIDRSTQHPTRYGKSVYIPAIVSAWQDTRATFSLKASHIMQWPAAVKIVQFLKFCQGYF